MGLPRGEYNTPLKTSRPSFHDPAGIAYHVGCPEASYAKRVGKSISPCCTMLRPQPFSAGPAHQRSWKLGACASPKPTPTTASMKPSPGPPASPAPPSLKLKRLMPG